MRHQRATRRFVVGTVLAVLAGILPVVGAGTPAQAAVPRVAQQWSELMYRSLTVGAEGTQLRATLATRQAAAAALVAEASAAEAAVTAAQAQLDTATTADASARARYATAARAHTTARKDLSRALARRPRNYAELARVRKALVAAEQELTKRRTRAERAAAALTAAQAGTRTAAAAAGAATAASTAAEAAVQRTRQQIAALPTATALRKQAAALSRDVVTQIRPVFTVADTTTVYGTTVHQRMAYSFRRMIDAARADGIVLGGGGFRTKQRQIELRTINGCPDVWTAPASSCRVPTAIPGRSLHEVGLAVDITSGGRSLTSASPGFTWLAANAARYGYVNLPSEPWHWSITGG